MIYLKNFKFLSPEQEEKLVVRETCYNTIYPFGILINKEMPVLNMNDITILYGGNGSGKTTALNIIADCIDAKRTTVYNKSSFWDDYVGGCYAEFSPIQCHRRMILTSDGVFDSMLGVRRLNEDIDEHREELFMEYNYRRNTKYQLSSLSEIEELRKYNAAKSEHKSGYVRRILRGNMREYSNGESALQYFTEKISSNGIFILDEPENSLSPERQIEFVKFIEESVRFYNCQFIIATHSPFILSLKDAKIYDMDSIPVVSKKWTDLKNVRLYYEFFKERENEF